MPAEDFLSLARREFERMKQLADRAIAQLPADRFFAALAEGDNSVAVMMKHVGGNLLSRWTDFLAMDGEKPGRRRDEEFAILPGDTRENLLAGWEQGWAALFGALQPLAETDLDRIVTIRGEPLTVRQAITRQLTHYSYHVGQIVFLAKHHCGEDWKSLSIPRDKSVEFNRVPEKYLGRT
jgi:hypothetical protein